jgi:hypothetical protein
MLQVVDISIDNRQGMRAGTQSLHIVLICLREHSSHERTIHT